VIKPANYPGAIPLKMEQFLKFELDVVDVYGLNE
jgi:hypothetical protein